jgi:hypothetical protein
VVEEVGEQIIMVFLEVLVVDLSAVQDQKREEHQLQ